jgi:hypothetical protein
MQGVGMRRVVERRRFPADGMQVEVLNSAFVLGAGYSQTGPAVRY